LFKGRALNRSAARNFVAASVVFHAHTSHNCVSRVVCI
jgi:hypothetical protein